MKRIRNSIGPLKPILFIACFAILSANAGNGNSTGPTNSWGEWRYKKLICGFTNALLATLNGHTLPMFAPELFDAETHVYLYGAVDGEVFGSGDMSLRTEDRDAVFNVEVTGSLCTKGSTPTLSFKLVGEGSGTVGGAEGEAQLDAKFVQTDFINTYMGGGNPEFYFAEGIIRGTVKQQGAKPVEFEEIIRVRLDNVPGHYGDPAVPPQLVLDLVTINEHRFAGHAHATNNLFGRYEGDPDDLLAKGTYEPKNGQLTMDLRGLGPAANAIKCTVTARVDSAPPGEPIHISEAVLKGKAYGQKPVWNGNGLVFETEP